MARQGLGVLAKLVSLTVGVIAIVVGVLSVYFPTRQLRELEADLGQRASVYCDLLGRQARSAVAFDDRETAREILEAVAADRDVTGLGLYTHGRPLRESGKLSRAAQLAGATLNEKRVFALTDRLIAVEPVQSLEGATGTLVIELSKASLEQSHRELVRAALLVGTCMLLVGLVLAFVIARSMTRRITAISRAATTVAAGKLDIEPLSTGARDEIGALANGFNAMVARLRGLIQEIHKNAQDEQQRLETLVSERTRELAERNRDLRLVMDNVEQGFLTIDRQGAMSEERSRTVDSWFGAPGAGTALWHYLDRLAPGCGSCLELGWSQVLDGFLPLEFALDQLPKRFEVGDRHYTIALRPVTRDDGGFDQALVVISDVTDTVARERAEEEDKENVALLGKLLEDRSRVEEFIDEARQLVERIESRCLGQANFRIAVHTLKGNAGLLGLTTLARACHEIESALANGAGIEQAPIGAVSKSFGRIDAKLSQFCQFFGSTANTTIDEASRQELLTAIQAELPHRELEQLVRSFALEPIELRMKRAADQVRALAARLGKGPVKVEVECERIRAARDDWQGLWLELPHVLRNAVDHGLESVEERTALGKGAEAIIRLRAYSTGEGLVVEVEDRGRGIKWERVRSKARELGLVLDEDSTEASLVEALFSDGLSTAESVTEISGRGVGLTAIRDVVMRRGGRVSVESRQGEGTKFSFVWPSAALVRGERTSMSPSRSSKDLPS